MKTASILSIVAVSLCLSAAAFAQSTIDKVKTQDILKQLTSQPRKTWISAGTIQATHHEEGTAKVSDPAVVEAETAKAVSAYIKNDNKRELTSESQKDALDAIPFNVWYKLANEYSMDSTVAVRYDGQRFYWDIKITSRVDSDSPKGLIKNSMTDEFHRDWNEHRIFAWDGQTYTTSTSGPEGTVATVDAAGRLGTPTVTGPLTAGLIPWGFGKFSYESLSAAEISTSEITLNNAKVIQMTIAHPDGTLTELDLDPSKGYAVTSATLTGASGFQAIYTLDYPEKPIADRWVPSSVVIERKNDSIEGKAPSFESWTFDDINTDTPSLSSFNVPMAMDATVEYVSPLMASSAVYANSYEAYTDELLAQRLAYGVAEGSRRQNCATAAVRHIAAGFGKSIPNTALADLVGPSGGTSLYNLKQFAQGQGLYGRIVKTDLAGLKNLGTTKAILHIPGKKHFVVLDRVDGQNVWLVDLSSRKFYYRQSVHFFPLEWTEGTALLLSDRPITGQFTEIPDTASNNVTGGAYFACNKLIQEFYIIGCDYLSGLCQGTYRIFFERYGCGEAMSGTCTYLAMIRMQVCACIPDPIYTCDLTGEWMYQKVPACE